MRERLREVAERVARRGVDLLREQAVVVRVAQAAGDARVRPTRRALAERELPRAPEPPDAEGALAPPGRRAVAVEAPVRGRELALDGRRGPAHARRRGGEVAVPGELQQRLVDLRAAEHLRVALERLAPPARVDLAA